MNTNSLRNILVIGLSVPFFLLFGSVFYPETRCELPTQPAVAASPTSETDESERPSGSVSDSVNPGIVIPDTTDVDGYRVLTFNDLAGWVYIYPDKALNFERRRSADAPLEDRLPDPIMALDSQQVSVVGFMMPTKGNRDGVTEFILVRNMMICCYGVAPRMNEWIYVRTADSEPVRYYRNLPVRVRGVFYIDEQVKDRYVSQLFIMTADDLEVDLPRNRSRSGFFDR